MTDSADKTLLTRDVLFILGFKLSEMDLSGWYTIDGHNIMLVNITNGYRDIVTGKDVLIIDDLVELMNNERR